MKIDEYGVLGASEVLKVHAPKLLPIVNRITSEGKYVPGGQTRGASVAGVFEFTMRNEDYEAVLIILQNVSMKEGPLARYGGQALSLTIDRWKRAAQSSQGELQ